jgi:hypothetical protein
VLIAAEDVGIELPAGWDGRVRRRPRNELPVGDVAIELLGTPLREHLVTAHAANFALPADDGDFGTGATSAMPRRGVFTSLVEFQPGGGLVPGVGLYAAAGIPGPLAPRDFDSSSMLRALPGQAGVQRFFTAAGRPFCLYAVVGSHRDAPVLIPQINALLAAVQIR